MNHLNSSNLFTMERLLGIIAILVILAGLVLSNLNTNGNSFLSNREQPTKGNVHYSMSGNNLLP